MLRTNKARRVQLTWQKICMVRLLLWFYTLSKLDVFWFVFVLHVFTSVQRDTSMSWVFVSGKLNILKKLQTLLVSLSLQLKTERERWPIIAAGIRAQHCFHVAVVGVGGTSAAVLPKKNKQIFFLYTTQNIKRGLFTTLWPLVLFKHEVTLNYKYMAITWKLYYSTSVRVERPVTSSNSLMTTERSEPHY